jgi:transcriptional regulator with XRE-family HTH domain
MKVFKGSIIREVRMKQGLTQFELVKKVNSAHEVNVVDAATISRWEINENAVPRNNKLVKVAEALGCSVEDFFETTDEVENTNKKEEQQIKILSLNVNQFCGLKNWSERIPEDEKRDNILKIVKYLKEFLDSQKNGLVVLQEFPWKGRDEYQTLWEELKQFIILKPKHLEKKESVFCTIGIANPENGWEEIKDDSLFSSEKDDYYNRIVEINNSNVRVFGVHIPADENEVDRINGLWNKLINKVEDMNNTIIIGDFNAHANNHRKSTFRCKLKKLEYHGYKDLVDIESVTYYKTATTLDHCFVSNEHFEGNSTAKVISNDYSDHALIIADIILLPNENNSV